jgi:hypothetical protein
MKIISRQIQWAGHETYMRQVRNAEKIFVVKPDRKRPLERHTHSWKDNMKVDTRGCRMDSSGSG